MLKPLPALPRDYKKRYGEDAFHSVQDEWSIVDSNAKQPNLNLLRTRHWQVQVDDLRLMKPAKARTYFTAGCKEGEGTYGVVFRVVDQEDFSKSLVMKLSKADANFFTEVSVLSTLHRSASSVPSNLPNLHDWFVIEELPTYGNWSTVSALVQKRFAKPSTKSIPYGVVVLERVNGGPLSSFNENYLTDNIYGLPCDQDLLSSVILELIFTASTLSQSNVVHRDISGSNILIRDTSGVKTAGPRYLQFGDSVFSVPVPSISPVLIDFGSANVLDIGSSMKTDFRFTTLSYRPPEMIFLSSLPNGKLLPNYSPKADLFSLGLCILELTMGDFATHGPVYKYENHPFLRHKPPAILKTLLLNLVEDLKSQETDFTKEFAYRGWCSMIHKGFLDKKEASQLSRYLWGMCYELGVPDDSVWPGIEQTHIWKILDRVITDRKSKNLPCPSSTGLMFRTCNLQHLSQSHLELILSMLRWNPKDRPNARDLLQSDVFDNFRIKKNNSLIIDPSLIWSIL